MTDIKPKGAAGVMAFIEAEIAAGRPFPSRVQVARHMGWKTTSGVQDALTRLVRWKRLAVTHREQHGRSWHYTYEILPTTEAR